MKRLKVFLIIILLFSFNLFAYGASMKPTEGDLFVSSFLYSIYNFDNNSLKNLNYYKFMYPMDKYSLNIREYMTEKTFDDFSKSKIYYNFILDSYSYGFNSRLCYINVQSKSKTTNNYTFTYNTTIELFYPHKSKREIYKVSGEVTVSKLTDGYKIIANPKIKFPALGSFPATSTLV